jgi:RecB family exonuclease
MHEFKLRASSIGDLFDCAKRWEARNVLNIRTPSSGAAHLGTSIHAGAGAYDASAIEGAQISIDDATGVLIDTLYTKTEEVIWDDDINPKKSEPIARKLLSGYCETVAPAHEYIAVESRCNDLTIDIDGVLLTLTGTVDRVRNENGALGISDLKTGKTAVATDGTVAARKHAVQLGAYEILAQHSIGIPMNADAEIIGMQTNGKARIGSGLIERPRDLLLNDGGVLEMAASIMKAGLFPPNPRSMLCSERFCPAWKTCAYK